MRLPLLAPLSATRRRHRPPLLAAAAAIALAVAVAAAVPRPLGAQAADTAAVADARRLIAAGEYEEAARGLAAWLERYPDAVGVRWLRARTLYWAGDHEHARRELREALERDPDYGPALELWREMRELWTPRLGVEAGLESDDQPLDRQGVRAEVGLPVSPWVVLRGDGAARRLDPAGPDAPWALEGRIGFTARPRGAPLRLAAAGGIHVRPALDRSAFVGTGRAALLLPAALELGLEARRWSYEHTAASADTGLFVRTLEGTLSRSDPVGWAGEVGGRLDAFPGGGAAAHAWVWGLAPLWTDGKSAVRLGYAFQHQDADTTTFRPAGEPPAGGGPPGGGPPGSGSGAVEGVYDPYYTPEGVRAHLALAAVRAALSPGVFLSADGGVGLHATEEAPRFLPAAGGNPGAPVELRFEPRDYTPWRIRARLSVELSASATLRLEVAHREEAFFRTTSLGAALETRFLGGRERP